MKNQILIKENSFEEARSEIKKNKAREIVFSSNNDELNRKVLEKLPINILLINQTNRKDRQKQRDSGFNQVLAKIAKKNKITIGINLDEIINSKQKEKAEILARIQQNIKLCNKNNLKMTYISQKHNKDTQNLRSLGLILGMPTWMQKKEL